MKKMRKCNRAVESNNTITVVSSLLSTGRGGYMRDPISSKGIRGRMGEDERREKQSSHENTEERREEERRGG